jgi:hypothetical protein
MCENNFDKDGCKTSTIGERQHVEVCSILVVAEPEIRQQDLQGKTLVP